MGRVCKKDGFSSRAGIGRNNCYAWALGEVALMTSGDSYKLQPGDLSTQKPFDLKSCKEVVQRVREDLAVVGGNLVSFKQPCKATQYKIALVLAPGVDYHFLVHHKDVKYQVTSNGETRSSIAKQFGVNVRNVERKDRYGVGTKVFVKGANCWSHKRGTAYAPTLMDSEGKVIKDPRRAKLDYGELNYRVFCATFCIPSRDKATCSTVKNTARRGLCVANLDDDYKKIRQKLAKIRRRARHSVWL